MDKSARMQIELYKSIVEEVERERDALQARVNQLEQELVSSKKAHRKSHIIEH